MRCAGPVPVVIRIQMPCPGAVRHVSSGRPARPGRRLGNDEPGMPAGTERNYCCPSTQIVPVIVEAVAAVQAAKSGRNLSGFLQVDERRAYSLVDCSAFVYVKIGVDGLKQGSDQVFVN